MPSARPWSARRPRPAPIGPAPARPRPETIWFELKDQHGATEFLGYDTERAEGVVRHRLRRQGRRCRQGRGQGADHRQPDAVLRRTGAARCSIGEASSSSGRAIVTGTAEAGALGLFVHYAEVTEGTKAGDPVTLEVDHAASPAVESFGDASHPRRCARCSAAMLPRRGRSSRPSGCASTLPIRSRCPVGGTLQGSRGDRQRDRGADRSSRPA